MQRVHIWQIIDIDKQVGHDDWKCILQNKLPSNADK